MLERVSEMGDGLTMLPFSQITDEIAVDDTNSFTVVAERQLYSPNRLQISYLPPAASGRPQEFSIIDTRIHSFGRRVLSREPLLHALIVNCPLIDAIAYEPGSYREWQSCTSEQMYRARYGETKGFGIVTLGTSPLPIRRLLDVSRNPGSSRVSGGLHFSVASEMYLGPGFWRYAACTKEEVLAADFILEKRETPHYLYIRTWPHPFTRPDGEQGRVQQKEDCEWPPGSGGISDEPVGGPPDLMPQPLPAS